MIYGFHVYFVSADAVHSSQWRHNGRDGVSNHQPHHCLLNRFFRCRSKKTSKLHVTGLCAGNSPVTGEFPAQVASNAENVLICWRHHNLLNLCMCLCATPLNVHNHHHPKEGYHSLYKLRPYCVQINVFKPKFAMTFVFYAYWMMWISFVPAILHLCY